MELNIVKEMELMTIEPKDQSWLEFLFYADACRRNARHAWNSQQYIGWFLLSVILYVVLYPILFIWDWKRKIFEGKL